MENQMFQYAFGRIIAEHKGYKLAISDPDKRQHQLFDNFPNAVTVDGKEVHHNQRPFAPDFQYINIDDALNHDGAIYLHGYWQKHYYYTPHAEKIRKWFAYDDSQHEKPLPTDLVVHVRLRDQLRPEPIGLPSQETYVELLRKIPYQRCILLSDKPDEPYLDPIKRLPGVVVKHSTQMADFTMIKHAKRLVISQSMFAWWAHFLGDPDVVFVPLTVTPTRCLWKKCPAVQDVDLIPLTGRYVSFSI